jgi:rare lipoprotein A
MIMDKESRAATRFRWALLIWGVVVLSGCRAKVDYHPGGYVQTGIASWYGEEFHGKETSSREIYDMNDLTAAHNSLPLGTYVTVTNLNNGRSVTVRINDRGPFVKKRVIDLSYAAARAIDMIGTGTAPVRIEVLPDISPPLGPLRFSIQTGSFVEPSNAETMRKELARQFADVYISSYETARQVYYRVRIRVKNREEAEALARALIDKGYPAIIFEEQ